MESTAADAMPDDTDLTPQAPEPEQAPAEASGETSTEPASATSTEPATSEANPVVELALKDLQERRDALEAEITALSSRKQQLETELKANFAGQSDAIARRVKGFQEYLVVPRMIAMVVMAPVQCFFFFFVAVWSGQLTSTALYNIPPAVFWTSVQTWMNPLDLPFMLVKALVFGLIIATVACGWGLTTRGGPKEVGTSTTGAVVMILILVALMDVVLTQVLFGA